MAASSALNSVASKAGDTVDQRARDGPQRARHRGGRPPRPAPKRQGRRPQGVRRRRRAPARPGGRDAADQLAGEQFDTAKLYMVERVQERPMTATLAALGAGFVLGLLFAGGRR